MRHIVSIFSGKTSNKKLVSITFRNIRKIRKRSVFTVLCKIVALPAKHRQILRITQITRDRTRRTTGNLNIMNRSPQNLIDLIEQRIIMNVLLQRAR